MRLLLATLLVFAVLFGVSAVGPASADDDDDDDDHDRPAACAAACAASCAAVCTPAACADPCPPPGVQVTHCRHFRRPVHGPSKGHLTARCWVTE